MLRFKEFVKEVEYELHEDMQLGYYIYLSEDLELDETILLEDYYEDEIGDSAHIKNQKNERRKVRDSYRNSLDSVYGKSKATDLPMTGANRVQSVEDHIRAHYGKSTEEQAKAIAAAKARMSAAYSKTPEDVQKEIKENRERLDLANKTLSESHKAVKASAANLIAAQNSDLNDKELKKVQKAHDDVLKSHKKAIAQQDYAQKAHNEYDTGYKLEQAKKAVEKKAALLKGEQESGSSEEIRKAKSSHDRAKKNLERAHYNHENNIQYEPVDTEKELQDRIYTSNSKLDTNVDQRDQNGRQISKTLGATGAPFLYRHQSGNKISNVSTCNKAVPGCSGEGGERNGNCLAMNGTYKFTGNAAKQDYDSQIQHDSRKDEHGNSPHLDWHLLAAHYALEEAKKAKVTPEKDENDKKIPGTSKFVALRTNVTDESKDALNNAIYKMKTGDIKIKKTDKDGSVVDDTDATHTIKHHLSLYNYGKDHENTLHDPEHNVFTIASDTGPIVSPGGELVRTNKGREEAIKKITTGENGNKERNHYTIVGGRSTTDKDEKGVGRLLRRSKKSDKADQEIWVKDKLNSIKTVRRYDLTSEPESDAGKDVHKDHEARDMGHGRVHYFHRVTGEDMGHGYIKTKRTINGEKRIIRYQDHKVIPNASEHDARYSPKEYDPSTRTYDKKGNRVGASIVSIPTSATSNEGTAEGRMFHDVNDIDKDGVLHVNHPDKIDIKRKSLEEHQPTREWFDKLDPAKPKK